MSEPLTEAELQEIETRAFSFGTRQDIPRLIASLREARHELQMSDQVIAETRAELAALRCIELAVER